MTLEQLKQNAHQAYCEWQSVSPTELNAERLPWLDQVVEDTANGMAEWVVEMLDKAIEKKSDSELWINLEGIADLKDQLTKDVCQY